MSVTKEKGKDTWKLDISKGYNAVTGKRNRFIKRNIKTRKEALELESYYRMTKYGDYSTIKGASLDILYEIMKDEDKKKQRKESYISSQNGNYNKHFSPYFKHATIGLLTYKDIDAFRETLLDKDLSNNTVNKQMILMKKLLDIAVKEGFLNENPCSQIKRLPVPKHKMNYWTVKEFQQFLTLLEPDDSSYKLIFKVLFSTGMRIGELLGLTWKDIDFNRKEIDVNKTLIHLPGRTILNEPKTDASIRKITIQSNLADELQSWKETQTARLSRFTDDVEQLQVFQFAPSIISRYMVTNKYNAILERTTELKRIRIHDFRHSHVALLIENGEEQFPIKERLGHASIQTTYDTYGHLYPSKQKSMSDKLNDLF
ncbi:TPA: tyrosine-type recombinase/integrase [Listeria monocytogenes]